MSGLFFTNDTSVGDQLAGNEYCPIWFGTYGFCSNQAQDPSLLNLSNGNVGVAFSVITRHTVYTCPGVVGNTTSQIAFASSSNGGQSFSALSYIERAGSATCPYYQDIEPSFAVGGGGTIFGAYVEANATPAQLGLGAALSGRPILPYYVRPADALAFVTSTDNGTTFSTARALVTGGNVSSPQIAAFGKTVYILYENISNGTRLLYGRASPPVALELLVSVDGGGNWSGPSLIRGYLPGTASGTNDTTMGPALAVSPTGTVGIAFTAKRVCWAFCNGFYATNASSLVVETSTNNGTSWNGPHVVATGVAELSPSFGFAGQGAFQNLPTVSLAFDPSSGALYVAWSQAVNLSLSDPYAYEYDWQSSAVFTGVSTNGGTSWTTTEASPALLPGDPAQFVYGQGYFNPAIGSNGRTVYLSYSHFVYSNGLTGYYSFLPTTFGQGDNQWLSTSVDGTAWSAPALLENALQAYGYNFFDYFGTQGSVGFTANGTPVVAWSLPTGYFQYDPTTGNYSNTVSLGVSTARYGPTVAITFQETGLPSGAAWSVFLNGNVFNATASAFTVNNVPTGAPVYVAWPGPATPVGYRAVREPVISLGYLQEFTAATTVYFNFTTFYGISLAPEPANVPYLSLTLADYGGPNPYYYSQSWDTYVSFGTPYFYTYGVAQPWYFPAGTNLSLSTQYSYPLVGNYYTYGFVDYWNGTGAGSFTGTGAFANLTVNSPFNESMWMAASAAYSERFGAPDLPASSTFSFAVDGTSYSGPGGGWVNVANLTTGAHFLSGISATSTQPGWVYFGHSDAGNPVVIPNQPTVNFSFAYENLSAPTGTLSFHGVGIPNGTVWELTVNGTTLSSDTPWINLTGHPGDYPIQAFPVVSSTGTSALAPVAAGAVASVGTTGSFDVNFTAAYQLSLLASAGGTVTPSARSNWLPANSTQTLTATASTGFSFAGWSGTGPGSYSGPNAVAMVTALGPITETATFVPLNPERFNLTVTETGLPAGTLWTAKVGGTTYSATGPTLFVPNVYSCQFSGALGKYALAIEYAYPNGSAGDTRFVPTGAPSTVCGASTAAVTFVPQYRVTAAATAGGSVAVYGGTPAGVDALWIGAGGSVTLSATPALSYVFDGWVGNGSGSYTGPLTTPVLAPTGPVTEIAEFTAPSTAPPPTYTLAFQAVPALATGTGWSLGLNGTNYSAAGPWINVSGLASGTYVATFHPAIAPDGQTEYIPSPASVTLHVTKSTTVGVAFQVEYWVAIAAAGPGTVGPASGFFLAGHTIDLTATPTGDATFVAWSGTGDAAYSGTTENTTLNVLGPTTETASFTAAPAGTSPAATSPWAQPTLWVGLAVAGLVVGLVLGLLLARRRAPPMSPTGEPAPAPEPAPEPSGESVGGSP